MEFTIGKNKYQFINESFSNYRNWGHKTRLFKNNVFLNNAKCIYLNRTWESYPYQSVMKKCLSDYISTMLDDYFAEYKKANNIKRLSSLKKEPLIVIFKKDNKEIFELYKKLGQ